MVSSTDNVHGRFGKNGRNKNMWDDEIEWNSKTQNLLLVTMASILYSSTYDDYTCPNLIAWFIVLKSAYSTSTGMFTVLQNSFNNLELTGRAHYPASTE
jgi:hypothetical protein